MQEQQLDRLISKIARGDNDALEELYEKTKRGVFAFLYSYLDNREDSEDAMQTVYLRIKMHAGSYREGSNARAWMLQIAKNIALNELKCRERRADADLSSMPARDERSELGITELMKKVLTEEERRIVTLHVLWGYRHREIAYILGCPVGTVTAKYNRSVHKLKRSLKETGI